MTRERYKQVASAILMGLLVQSTCAAETLMIKGVKAGVTEVDLFDPSSGSYVRSVAADGIQYPIDILEDQQGMFVIEIEGERYTVGSSFINTTKTYNVIADCQNALNTSTVASSRGVAGKGCAQ
ncbi:hypothetical protein VRRI112168_15260 [Vreelandella rituensis]|uniref:Uncharacterized protein n=1 Tax=Vreelandella rituensis TaxID=2282306 RepID=A0A368U1N6_9GAMM|nr:hypothetical protein [Halomonas rituensis]RCV89982.1 hypothetical protein DU506_12290 [Halomonas rituensis]